MLSWNVIFLSLTLLLLSLGQSTQASHYMRIRRSSPKLITTIPPPPPFKVCPCSSEPCFHGGHCTNKIPDGEADITFSCECEDAWSGEQCDDCETGDGSTTELCSNECMYKNNDICEDGGIGSESERCTIGQDCIDCGSRCVKAK